MKQMNNDSIGDADPLDRAVELYESGNIEGAIPLFRQAIEEEPDDPEFRWMTYHWLTQCYSALGRYKEALEVNTLALSGQDDSTDPRLRYHVLNDQGWVYRKLGQWDKSVEWYLEAEKYIDYCQDEEWDTQRYSHFINKGHSLLGLERPQEALGAFQIARSILAGMPDKYPDADVLCEADMAEALIAVGDIGQALAIIEKLHWEVLNPAKRGEYFYMLGLDLYNADDFPRALAMLERIDLSAATEENRALDWHLLGRCYHRLGRHDEAVAAYRKSLRNRAGADWVHQDNRAFLLELTGQWPA